MALDFKKRFDIGLALMVCLALPGCVLLEAVPTPDGRVCNVSYDCLCVGCGANESFGCNGGVCSAICNTDSDCASEVCLGGYCQQEAECEVDADCAENNSNLCVQSTCNKGMCNTNTVNCPLPESYCGESGYVTFNRYCFPQSGCGLQQEIVPYESLDTTQYECQEALEGCDPDACEAAMGQCQTFLECTSAGSCRLGLLTHGANFSALCSLQGKAGVCVSGVCIDPSAGPVDSDVLGGGVSDATYDGSLSETPDEPEITLPGEGEGEGEGEEESGSDEERVAKPPTLGLFYSYLVDGVWQPLEGVTKRTRPPTVCAQVYGEDPNTIFSAEVSTVETVPFHQEDCTGDEECTVEEQVAVFACVPATNTGVYRVIRPMTPDGAADGTLYYLYVNGEGLLESSSTSGASGPVIACEYSYPDEGFNRIQYLTEEIRSFTGPDGVSKEATGKSYTCLVQVEEEELETHVPSPKEEFAINNTNLMPHGCTYSDPASNEKNYEVCNSYIPDALRHAAPSPEAWEEINKFLEELMLDGYLGGVCAYDEPFSQAVAKQYEETAVAGNVEPKVNKCNVKKDATATVETAGQDCVPNVEQTLSVEATVAHYEKATTEVAKTHNPGAKHGLCEPCLENNDCISAVVIPADKVVSEFAGMPGIDAYHPLTKATYCVPVTGTCVQCIHHNDCECLGDNVPSCDNGTCVCGN